MSKKTPIDCRKCVHYHVTWEPARPHGCRAMGFKSQHLPSLVVIRNSGTVCLYFRQKHFPASDNSHTPE